MGNCAKEAVWASNDDSAWRGNKVRKSNRNNTVVTKTCLVLEEKESVVDWVTCLPDIIRSSDLCPKRG